MLSPSCRIGRPQINTTESQPSPSLKLLLIVELVADNDSLNPRQILRHENLELSLLPKGRDTG